MVFKQFVVASLAFTFFTIISISHAHATSCLQVSKAFEGRAKSIFERASYQDALYDSIMLSHISPSNKTECLLTELEHWNSAHGNSPNLRQKIVSDNWSSSLPAIKLRMMISTLYHQIDSDDQFKLIRILLSPEIISALTWGAQLNDDRTRMLSTYILGDVITPNFSCIIAAHLADPKIANGKDLLSNFVRANLLAVGRVVAKQKDISQNLRMLFNVSKKLQKSVDGIKFPETFKSIETIVSTITSEGQVNNNPTCFSDRLTFPWAAEAIINLPDQ